jgi:hypothetical protein
MCDAELWFSGLGSAVVGGVVAALTALLVVVLTDRKNRRLAREREAREHAVAIMETNAVFQDELMHLLENTQDDVRKRALVEGRWLASYIAKAAPLLYVDQTLDPILSQYLEDVHQAVKGVDELGPRPTEQAEEAAWIEQMNERQNKVTHLLTDMSAVLAEWVRTSR